MPKNPACPPKNAETLFLRELLFAFSILITYNNSVRTRIYFLKYMRYEKARS